MQKRAGERLPKEAWDHQGFEHLPGGRTSMGVRIEADGTDLWRFVPTIQTRKFQAEFGQRKSPSVFVVVSQPA